MDDFWAMVWESHSSVIAMLTKLVEDGREKVYQVGDRSQHLDTRRDCLTSLLVLASGNR